MAVARSCSSASEQVGQCGTKRVSRLLGSVHPELWILATAILILNHHLLPGLSSPERAPLAFFPDLVETGEWWRLFTHPFVHVSGYHLLLDASACLLLYAALEARSLSTRLSVLAASALGSLGAAWMLCPEIEEIGFCGLSGIDHGLMAFGALELMRSGSKDRRTFAQGAAYLSIVLGKSLYEVLTGRCAFDFLHLGSIGTPLVACHFGGAIGGVVAFMALHIVARGGRAREGTRVLDRLER